jgi:hypothetical protein
MTNIVKSYDGHEMYVAIANTAIANTVTWDRLLIIQDNMAVQNQMELTQRQAIDFDNFGGPKVQTSKAERLSHSINGEGTCGIDMVSFYTKWLYSGEAKLCRVVRPGIPGGQEAHYILSKFDESGERTSYVRAQIQLDPEGTVEWKDEFDA